MKVTVAKGRGVCAVGSGECQIPTTDGKSSYLISTLMTKQFPIPAFDHRAAIVNKIHDRVALWGRLPLVSAHPRQSEDSGSDLQLRGAVTMSIDGLQHAPGTRSLLRGHASVRRNGPAVQGSKKPKDGFHAIEPVDTKGDKRREGLICFRSSKDIQMDMLPTDDAVNNVVIGIVVGCDRVAKRLCRISARR